MIRGEKARQFTLAFESVKNSVSNSVEEKARRIFEEGRVSLKEELPTENIDDLGFRFQVVGDHDTYNTDVILTENDWEVKCTCQTRGYYCSHELATLIFIKENWEIENTEIELPQDGLDDYMNSYSHDTVNIGLIADLIGVEIEFTGDKNQFWNLWHKDIKSLIERGWKIKYDASVSFEFVSPIMSHQEFLNLFKRYERLFISWGQASRGGLTGIHIHLSMDKFFAIGKRPNSETYSFLRSLIAYFEDNILTEQKQKSLFGRKFNRYAVSMHRNEGRYNWINLTTLDRPVGKTIEIRLFSVKKAGELPQIIEVAHQLKKYTVNSLLLWRKQGRPDFETFINENKPLLKHIFNKPELVSFLKIFKPEALRKIS